MAAIRTMNDYWQHLSNHVAATSEESDRLFDIFNVKGNMKRRRSLLVASHLDKRIAFLVVLGETQKAIELAKLSMEYIHDAEINDNRNTGTGMMSEIDAAFLRRNLKYHFDWTVNGKDNELLAKEALVIVEDIVQNKLAKRYFKSLKTDLLECVDLSLKSGDFDKAEKYIRMTISKVKPKNDAEIILDESSFLDFIIRARSNSQNEEVRRQFSGFFQRISTEVEALNKYGLTRAADIALIYFKYFRYDHIDNPSRTDVLQSIRYGV